MYSAEFTSKSQKDWTFIQNHIYITKMAWSSLKPFILACISSVFTVLQCKGISWCMLEKTSLYECRLQASQEDQVQSSLSSMPLWALGAKAHPVGFPCAVMMRMSFPVGSPSLSALSPLSEIAWSHCHSRTILEQSLPLHSALALWSLGYCTDL